MKAAHDWIAENEQKFLMNPSRYFDWRDNLYKEMTLNKEETKDGIIRPRT